jgi:hypothetical protein
MNNRSEKDLHSARASEDPDRLPCASSRALWKRSPFPVLFGFSAHRSGRSILALSRREALYIRTRSIESRDGVLAQPSASPLRLDPFG